MPTDQLLNGLSGNLQSSDSWARQQALTMIRDTLTRTMSSLTEQQQRDYVRLQREAHQALQAVERENATIRQAFKTDGLAKLRSKLGGLDPEALYLNTRYLEKLEPPLPWEPRTSEPLRNSINRRLRRAYDEWKYRAHESRLSLWDAACLNFDFATANPQSSGHSFVDASYLSGAENLPLTVERFIEIVRELDLGGQLQTRLQASLEDGGKLHSLLQASTRACLLFEALEAYRNRTTTGVSQAHYQRVVDAVNGKGEPLGFDTLGMNTGITLLPTETIGLNQDTIPIPLLLIHVASLGVLSYFPFRPGGALRYHTDARQANADFVQQLKDSHRQGDLGWFALQLPMTEMQSFKQLLKEQPRPAGLSAAAGFLYDAFHRLFPQRSLDSLRFTPDNSRNHKKDLVHTCANYQVLRYEANLAVLATSRSARDRQALIDGAAAIAQEILEMLMIPVPGGVTGLNRIMQVAVFGSLAHSLVVGINQAARGEASEFAAAMADAADLAINGLLITTAGRVHTRRMHQLFQRLGSPRKVTDSNGEHRLWTPAITPYAIVDQHLLDGQIANAQGVYQIDGRHYAWLQAGEERQVVEVSYDVKTMRFVLKLEYGGQFAAPIVFDPTVQAWVLDLHNAHTLSDIQLAERMLPDGSSTVPRAEMENMLRSTAADRATLDSIWAGNPSPINLTEGVRRLQADRVIEQLINDFHRRGHMPAHADGAVLCLLPYVPAWPAEARINVHNQQGSLIETYAARESGLTYTLDLMRRDDGTYGRLTDPITSVPTQEQLFELIFSQQPTHSLLGKEGSPLLSQDQRIARVRLQISELARTQRHELFSAMTRYNGYARGEVPADIDARQLLPIKVAPPLVEVTPLLKKLRGLYPPLTPANLEQLLLTTPLSNTEQATFLRDASLPPAVHENLEHHRTALRLDAIIDGLYSARKYDPDTDLWAREFTTSLLLNTLNRHCVITDMSSGTPTNRYVSSGPDDTTVELLYYGQGRYEAYDMRNAGPIPVSPAVDSFYLAVGSVLQPGERQQLGMKTASDAKGLRKTLGDLMSAQRGSEGHVSLLDQSLGQYEQSAVLPHDLKPDATGIYEWQGEQLLPLYGSLYPITFDKRVRKWRLKHPKKVGVDTPLLEHNRQGAWRLASENPMAWDDHRLFYRLGSEDFNVDQSTASQIMRLTDTPARALREVHSSGLPPPPLLHDTSKRFRIEREILQFIKAMSVYSATRNARPSLQLQLISSLPAWPATHALEIVDSQGRVIRRYPSKHAANAEAVRLTEAESRSLEPLKNIALNDQLCRVLLGELPTSQEERLFKLSKKIAEYAWRERAQLFDILYAQSERGTTSLERRLQVHYPQLPLSAITAILEQSSPKEIKQLHTQDQVGLRLAEQARLTADDARLNRAYEGLYLSTLANPDSEKIMVHLLKDIPGWPLSLRLDIRDASATGPLLTHAGQTSGTDRRTLVKIDGGYQSHDREGRLLNEPDDSTLDLLSAVVLILDKTERGNLGLDDNADPAALRHAIAELALNQRVAIKSLLGLTHIPPWLQPPMNVNSSFQAYPFSLRSLWPFNGHQPVDLVAKVKDIYPRFSTAQANDLLESLNMSEPAALIELQRREAEYRTLAFELDRWVETAQPVDDPDTDPVGWNYGVRTGLKNHILAAWRRETHMAYDSASGLFDSHQLILRLDGNSLPDPAFMLGTRGFEHIEFLMIQGDTFPATGNDFLGKFPGLIKLQIDCMLNELPTNLTSMRQLQHLALNDNAIVLTSESRERLAGMTQLDEIHLDGNPLGLTPDVSRMTRLRVLSLRQTNIEHWPIGAEGRSSLRSLRLQENRLTTVPEAVFSDIRMGPTNRNTILHDNPLSDETLGRIRDYRNRTGIVLGGALPGILHQQAMAIDVSRWLVGVPSAQHTQRQNLWKQLQNSDGARPDDTFRVLRDLTQSFAYRRNAATQQALTQRVWHLLDAMGESTELRNQVFLNTYVAGTCGDGAILAFINMELQHQVHQARSQAGSNQADRELLALAKGLFYLRQVDELADAHIARLRANEGQPDDAEITLYYRLKFRDAYNLPIRREEMLYSVEDWVSEQDITDAHTTLAALSQTQAAQNSLLMEDFWIEYLARSYPEPFSTINNVIRHQLNVLDQEVPDRRSDVYLERRQSLAELEIAERNRLVRQLTEAAQLAQQVS
ncbi:NEL domain-containing protein [Pseudomonas sp. HN11]|uniref:NEL domain-containing protein n=1 Tax=Pseudomonas sp. HN11 TaxID=1344094 RepID=UPI001F1B49AC|nr:NEL domain-containing protein [Pseudomonas sp. HN11]UII72616.1 NEL domain-containing protein [Pseudomonas sp. HN11]